MIKLALFAASAAIAVLAMIGAGSLVSGYRSQSCIDGVAKAAVWLVENNRTVNAPPIDTLLHVSCE